MSTVTVRLASAADAAAWDAFLESAPLACGYHRWAWRDWFEQQFALSTYYLIAERPGGCVAGLLPLVQQSTPLRGTTLMSLPFVNYAGLVSEADDATVALLSAVADLVKQQRAVFAELRGLPGASLPLPSHREKVRAVLALPERAEELLQSFPAKLRSQIKRARSAGLSTEVGGAGALDEFYRLLATKWRSLCSPIYRARTFEWLLDRFADRVSLVTVRQVNQVIGAGWLYHDRQSTEIVWAATLREFDRLSPNMLLYWTAMEHAIELGSRQFDFGRSTRDATTHRFKMQWGSVTEELPWHYVLGTASHPPESRHEGSAARLFKSVWSRLPLGLTTRWGQTVARRLPL